MPPIVRSIVAVVAGFLVIGALAFGTGKLVQATWPAQVDAAGSPTTTLMMIVQLLYVGVYATFGCWLAGRLAPSRPRRHALVVGVLGLALNVPSALPLRDSAPTWYLAAGVLTTMLWASLPSRGSGGDASVRRIGEARALRRGEPQNNLQPHGCTCCTHR